MLFSNKSQAKSSFVFFNILSHLTANVNRNANDHGRNSNASNEGDAHWSTNQGPQLPQNLFLSTPRLLPPERAAGRTTGKNQGRLVAARTRKSKNIHLKQWNDSCT